MANNPHFSATARKAALDAMLDLLDGGTLEVYDGSQPANPEAGTGGATLLVTLTLNATAFPASAGAAGATVTATANAITSGTAGATGTPAWFRAKSSGGTAHLDGSAGSSGCDLNLTGLVGGQILNGATVSASSFTVTKAA